MNKPTHLHTHLQAAQSQYTDQSLQKSVLFANPQPNDNQSDLEKWQQITHAKQKSRNFGYDERIIVKLMILDRK